MKDTSSLKAVLKCIHNPSHTADINGGIGKNKGIEQNTAQGEPGLDFD